MTKTEKKKLTLQIHEHKMTRAELNRATKRYKESRNNLVNKLIDLIIEEWL